MDVAACAIGALSVVKAIFKHLPAQVAPPHPTSRMLALNGVVLICPFCMVPERIMLPLILECDALFTAIHTRFPRLALLFDVATVRILCFFAVGVSEYLILMDGLIIDVAWAASVASKSRGMTGPGPCLARLGALARLSPRVSVVMAMYS